MFFKEVEVDIATEIRIPSGHDWRPHLRIYRDEEREQYAQLLPLKLKLTFVAVKDEQQVDRTRGRFCATNSISSYIQLQLPKAC